MSFGRGSESVTDLRIRYYPCLMCYAQVGNEHWVQEYPHIHSQLLTAIHQSARDLLHPRSDAQIQQAWVPRDP